MNYLRVPNLDKFQHYKDRTPPWIKLHNSILEDYEFACLPDNSKWHLVAIWLLASRTENKFPADPKWIAHKISATGKVDIDILLSHGFLELTQGNQRVQDVEGSDSTVLAPSKQSAIERRGEERREEGEKRESVPEVVIAGLNARAWDDYMDHRKALKAKKLRSSSIARQQKWLVEQGDNQVQAAIVEASVRNGWVGLFDLRSKKRVGVQDTDFVNWVNQNG